MPTFRNLLLLIAFLAAFPMLAQPPRESSPFWATKGQSLMRAGQYAEAYSAFQLAKSLGAGGMTAQMELAKKRNLNSIQFRALISEARLLATTDPTQSLRLLEYARQQFPDSTTILKAIGEVANQPDNWYYTLRADSIRASPKFTYLLADTDKTRLYLRRGDSLTLVHTFAEKPLLRVFSPNDDYLFVTTGNGQRGSLYALKGLKMTLNRSFADPVTNVQFSPNRNPANGSWLLVERGRSGSQLYNLQVPAAHPLVFASASFSPNGRYLFSSKGLWELGPIVRQLMDGRVSGRFSPDEKHLLVMFSASATESYAFSYELRNYTFAPKGDSLAFTGETLGYRGNSTFAYGEPFSPDGRYLLASYRNGLLFYDKQKWQPVQPVKRPGAAQPSLANSGKVRDEEYVLKISPDSRHVLISVWRNDKQVIQLWRLDGLRRHLLHEFDEKERADTDVFSPDGKYLLAKHATNSRLWQVDTDTIRLVHTFSKPLRQPDTFDSDGNILVSSYFSPNSRYLLTYSATPDAVDSLWQLTADRLGDLLPVHSFSNRLKAARTFFSPDSKFLLTQGSGPQPAMFWNIAEQIPLQSIWTTPPKQAFFSPRGNYLLTDLKHIAWHVTDRTLRPFSHPYWFRSPATGLFSPDERYLLFTTPPEPENKNLPLQYETALYSLNTDSLLKVRQYATKGFQSRYFGGITPLRLAIDPYQSGLFSPDGTQWLQTQAVSNDQNDRQYGSDSLWNLSGENLSRPPYILNPVDRFTASNPTTATARTWYSRPSALFSPDSRFLMTGAGQKTHVYTLKPVPSTIRPLPEQSGQPVDVSANASYWLTGQGKVFSGRETVLNVDITDYSLPDTPDTVRLWQRTGTVQNPVWQELLTVGGLYQGLNRYWQGNRRQSWFSINGTYLLLPTIKPALTTLYSLIGNTIRPVYSLNTQLMAAAHIPPAPKDGWDAGLLYTTMNNQTYLLRYSALKARTTSLGFGVTAYPPKFQNKLAYWVRMVDDSQQNLEILDLVTATTLVTIPFGAVLDFTVRPDGNVWVVSSVGARLIRSPGEMVNWLNTAPIAPLSAELRAVFVFL